jgi:hypothetical protein
MNENVHEELKETKIAGKTLFKISYLIDELIACFSNELLSFLRTSTE